MLKRSKRFTAGATRRLQFEVCYSHLDLYLVQRGQPKHKQRYKAMLALWTPQLQYCKHSARKTRLCDTSYIVFSKGCLGRPRVRRTCLTKISVNPSIFRKTARSKYSLTPLTPSSISARADRGFSPDTFQSIGMKFVPKNESSSHCGARRMNLFQSALHTGKHGSIGWHLFASKPCTV